MLYLTRRFVFSAAHRLESPDLDRQSARTVYGSCGEDWHGHDYCLDVTVAGRPDPRTGLLINMRELKRIVGERLIERLDHRCLNTDVPFLAGVIPSMENLVIECWAMLEQALPDEVKLVHLRLAETADCWVDYPGPPRGIFPRAGKDVNDGL